MNPENYKRDWAKVSTKLVRGGLLLVVGVSAWMGIWMSGMSRPWAMACSVFWGMMAMAVGMVAAGVRYHREMGALVASASEEAGRVKADLDKLREDVARQNRQFGISAVAMAKTVADGVAAKIMARHTRNLPGPEHIEAAMKEAQVIVTEEIVAYGETLRRHGDDKTG